LKSLSKKPFTKSEKSWGKDKTFVSLKILYDTKKKNPIKIAIVKKRRKEELKAKKGGRTAKGIHMGGKK